MCTLETNRYLARQVGIAYALSILLQFATNNLIRSTFVEVLVFSLFLLALAALLLKTERAVEAETTSADASAQIDAADTGKFTIRKSRESAPGILLFLLVALWPVFSARWTMR